jgi:hypothetical protein
MYQSFADEDERTRARIAKMLREDTGRDLCDSGGIYGRHWERNQGRDFEGEPEVRWSGAMRVDLNGDPTLDLDLTVSTYKHLLQFLSVTPVSEEFQSRFESFAGQQPEDEAWEDLLDKFMGDSALKTELIDSFGLDPCIEGSLDQPYLMWHFRQDLVDGPEDIVIIRSHNGCDMRGGFSSPYFFSIALENLSFGIYCRCVGTEEDSGRWTIGPHEMARADGVETTVDEAFSLDDGVVVCRECGHRVEFCL